MVALRASGADGRVAPDLVAALDRDAHLLAQLVRTLLDANFEPSLHPDICAAAGLDLETVEMPRLRRTAGRARRSAEFRRQVLIAYEYQCAFCGYDGTLGGVAVALDAAHVRWWAFDGPDSVDNGLYLCALHHKLFDKGVFGMDQQRTITASREFIGRSPSAREHVLALAERTATAPQLGPPVPQKAHLHWHHRQVFRAQSPPSVCRMTAPHGLMTVRDHQGSARGLPRDAAVPAVPRSSHCSATESARARWSHGVLVTVATSSSAALARGKVSAITRVPSPNQLPLAQSRKTSIWPVPVGPTNT